MFDALPAMTLPLPGVLTMYIRATAPRALLLASMEDIRTSLHTVMKE
jgi:hypothetical protein